MNLNKRATWLIGAPVVIVATLPLGPDMASRLMSGDFSTLTAIKWSSIAAAVGIALFFLIRQGVFANENLEEGERGYRRRWGRIISKRKTGQRKVLMPGKKHFYVKHWYDVVVQSVRVRSSPEEPKYNEPVRATYRNRNIWYLLVIIWRVDDTDEAIYKSLTQVYQVKRAQEGSDALENYVTNEVYKTVRSNLEKFDADSNGLPRLTVDDDAASVPDDLKSLVAYLRESFGVIVMSIDPVLLTIAPEESIMPR